jgi:hypothetical protein
MQHQLAPNVVVHIYASGEIYKATARWNYEEHPNTVLCSSIYALDSGEWKLVFHQQTPVAA